MGESAASIWCPAFYSFAGNGCGDGQRRAGIESAIEAMRVGAFDYITKPLELRHVQAVVHRALSHQKLLADKRLYENHLEEMVQQRTAEVERLAYYDSLTDLPNRALFADRTQQALNNATHNHETVGLLLVSLDRFKKSRHIGHETEISCGD